MLAILVEKGHATRDQRGKAFFYAARVPKTTVLQALYWFHPLVWGIPAAHGLACEQEADRIASRQLEKRELYAQSLARLTLRVVTLARVETTLTLNAVSQIARRLHYLKRERLGAWKRGHSFAAFVLVGSLFAMTAGSGFSEPSQLQDKLTVTPKIKRAFHSDDCIKIKSVTGTATKFQTGWTYRIVGTCYQRTLKNALLYLGDVVAGPGR